MELPGAGKEPKYFRFRQVKAGDQYIVASYTATIEPAKKTRRKKATTVRRPGVVDATDGPSKTPGEDSDGENGDGENTQVKGKGKGKGKAKWQAKVIVRTDISRPKPRTLETIDDFDADDDATGEEDSESGNEWEESGEDESAGEEDDSPDEEDNSPDEEDDSPDEEDDEQSADKHARKITKDDEEDEDDEEDAVANVLELASANNVQHPSSPAMPANSGDVLDEISKALPGPASTGGDRSGRLQFLQSLNTRVEYQQMLLRVKDQVR